MIMEAEDLRRLKKDINGLIAGNELLLIEWSILKQAYAIHVSKKLNGEDYFYSFYFDFQSYSDEFHKLKWLFFNFQDAAFYNARLTMCHE